MPASNSDNFFSVGALLLLLLLVLFCRSCFAFVLCFCGPPLRLLSLLPVCGGDVWVRCACTKGGKRMLQDRCACACAICTLRV